MHNRLGALILMPLVLGNALNASTSLAQGYPAKPVYITVGNAPGGTADTVARLLAPQLSSDFRQSIVVDNRPGASGAIAAERVARSRPDGYTLLMLAGGDTVLPALRSDLPYNLERDFAAISLVEIVPQLLVIHPSVPARSLPDLIRLMRAHPDKMSYASAGTGSTAHLAMALLNQIGHVRAVHVPYKGGSPAATATATGEVDMSFVSATAALSLLESAKVRVLAVSTAKRLSLMPNIPTVSEAGLPKYERYGWNGLVAPTGTRPEIIAALNAAVVNTLKLARTTETLQRLGLEPKPTTPTEFGIFIRDEIAVNAKLVKITTAHSN